MFKRLVSVPMRALKWLVFGSVQFSEQEEYLEFRYKFLIVLMLTAAAVHLGIGEPDESDWLGTWPNDDHFCYWYLVAVAVVAGFTKAI
jgi:hypothetical protein